MLSAVRETEVACLCVRGMGKGVWESLSEDLRDSTEKLKLEERIHGSFPDRRCVKAFQEESAHESTRGV